MFSVYPVRSVLRPLLILCLCALAVACGDGDIQSTDQPPSTRPDYEGTEAQVLDVEFQRRHNTSSWLDSVTINGVTVSVSGSAIPNETVDSYILYDRGVGRTLLPLIEQQARQLRTPCQRVEAHHVPEHRDGPYRYSRLVPAQDIPTSITLSVLDMQALAAAPSTSTIIVNNLSRENKMDLRLEEDDDNVTLQDVVGGLFLLHDLTIFAQTQETAENPEWSVRPVTPEQQREIDRLTTQITNAIAELDRNSDQEIWYSSDYSEPHHNINHYYLNPAHAPTLNVYQYPARLESGTGIRLHDIEHDYIAMTNILNAIRTHNNADAFVSAMIALATGYQPQSISSKQAFIQTFSYLYATMHFPSVGLRQNYLHFILRCGQMY